MIGGPNYEGGAHKEEDDEKVCWVTIFGLYIAHAQQSGRVRYNFWTR